MFSCLLLGMLITGKSYTIQHVAALTVFSLYLQTETSTIAQTLSNGGREVYTFSALTLLIGR